MDSFDCLMSIVSINRDLEFCLMSKPDADSKDGHVANRLREKSCRVG